MSSASASGQLILISAPSGAGKTSLVRAALEQDNQLVVSVSHTTRERRNTETDGENYYFVDHDTFDAMVMENAFLEHARVFDQQYGTSKNEVERLLKAGKDVILEIDWQGAEQVRRAMPDTVGIFILPPSVAELKRRLESRGQNSPESMARRLSEARLEMSQAPHYDYIVVNDDFDTALADMMAIMRAIRLSSERQRAVNPTVQAILSDS